MSYLSQHYTTGENERPTPQWVVDFIKLILRINRFDLDVACTLENCKADKGITKEENALLMEWICDWAWMNPPYSTLLREFMIKGLREVWSGRCKNIAMLVPVRSDAGWWHHIGRYATRAIMFEGRIQYLEDGGQAPFANALFVFTHGQLNRKKQITFELVKLPKAPGKRPPRNNEPTG
jgi:hypothetical protein